jgi:hypothetical protein
MITSCGPLLDVVAHLVRIAQEQASELERLGPGPGPRISPKPTKVLRRLKFFCQALALKRC